MKKSIKLRIVLLLSTACILCNITIVFGIIKDNKSDKTAMISDSDTSYSNQYSRYIIYDLAMQNKRVYDTLFSNYILILDRQEEKYCIRCHVIYYDVDDVIVYHDISYGEYNQTDSTILLKDTMNDSLIYLKKSNMDEYICIKGLLPFINVLFVKSPYSATIYEYQFMNNCKSEYAKHSQHITINSINNIINKTPAIYLSEEYDKAFRLIFNKDNKFEYYLNKMLIITGVWRVINKDIEIYDSNTNVKYIIRKDLNNKYTIDNNLPFLGGDKAINFISVD